MLKQRDVSCWLTASQLESSKDLTTHTHTHTYKDVFHWPFLSAAKQKQTLWKRQHHTNRRELTSRHLELFVPVDSLDQTCLVFYSFGQTLLLIWVVLLKILLVYRCFYKWSHQRRRCNSRENKILFHRAVCFSLFLTVSHCWRCLLTVWQCMCAGVFTVKSHLKTYSVKNEIQLCHSRVTFRVLLYCVGLQKII